MRRIERLWRSDLRAADLLRDHGFELDRGATWPVALAVAYLAHRNASHSPAPHAGGGEITAPDIADIAKATALPRTTVRRAIERLEERGLVDLDRSLADGRQRLIYPTAQFDGVMQSVSQAVDSCYRSAFKETHGAAASAPKWAIALIERIPDAVLITDAPAPGAAPRVLAANTAFERLSGYQATDILGRSPAMLQGPETDEDVRTELRQAIDQRKPATGQFLNYRKDGSHYLCELILEPLSSAGTTEGQPSEVDFFLGIAREIA